MDFQGMVTAAITSVRSDAALLAQCPDLDPAAPHGEENWATVRSFLATIPLDRVRQTVEAEASAYEAAEIEADDGAWSEANLEMRDLQDRLARAQAEYDQLWEESKVLDLQVGDGFENPGVRNPGLRARLEKRSESLAEARVKKSQELNRLHESLATAADRRDLSRPPGASAQDALLRFDEARGELERKLVESLARSAAEFWPTWGVERTTSENSSQNPLQVTPDILIDGRETSEKRRDDEIPPGTAAAGTAETNGNLSIREGQSRPLARGSTRDYVDPDEPLTASHDRMGFSRYVDMFGALIADPQTELPLSIGLFAPWGSGKSTFMALLRGNVADRSAAPADGSRPQRITQISFNAWHFADSNLWASIGDRIFAALHATDPVEPVDPRDAAETRLAQASTLRDAAKASVDAARRATDLARADAELADRSLAVTAAGLIKTDRGRRWIEIYLRTLGLSTQIDQGRVIVKELEATRDHLGSTEQSSRSLLRRPSVLVTVVLLIAAATAFAALSTTLSTAVRAGVGTTLTLLAAWSAVLRRGAASIDSIVDQLASSAPSTDDPRLAAYRAAQAQQAEAVDTLREAQQTVDRLTAELALLQPGARLYRFLADRAAGEVYSSHLSLVSTMRNDLAQLEDLLTAARFTSLESEENPGIDRIVLYVDDLDRCSPSQVMDVLEAVHLLLSGRIFVVVLGVDPRWLLHSVTMGLAGKETDPERFRMRLPTEYLEKIINIPFTLPSLGHSHMPDLLAGMIGELDLAEPNQTHDAVEPSVPALQEAPDSGTAESDLSNTTPLVLPRAVTKAELDCLAELAPLVRTPRAARRLVNTYRMLRAIAPDPDRFLGESGSPQFPAVAVMIALVATYGRSAQILLQTETLERFSAWGEVIDATKPTASHDGSQDSTVWRNGVVGALENEDLPTWRDLHDVLQETSELAGRAPYDAWLAWNDVARRFCVPELDHQYRAG